MYVYIYMYTHTYVLAAPAEVLVPEAVDLLPVLQAHADDASAAKLVGLAVITIIIILIRIVGVHIYVYIYIYICIHYIYIIYIYIHNCNNNNMWAPGAELVGRLPAVAVDLRAQLHRDRAVGVVHASYYY